MPSIRHVASPLFAAAALSSLALAACHKKESVAPSAPASTTVAGGAVSADPAVAASPPRRAAGLWELRQSIEGVDRVNVVQMCVDAASEEKMSVWSNGANRKLCPENHMEHGLDGSWKFSSTCNMGSGGTVVSTGVVEGDFTNHYTVKVDSTVSGAAVPQMNGHHTMTMEAKRVGACAKGQVGGDMIMPGGMKMNALKTMGG